MSLINEALKKAQRQRTEAPLVAPPMPGGGGRVTKRGVPMRAQTIALIVAGCVVLVVLSVGGTIFLVRGKSPAEKPVASKASPPKPELPPAKIEPPPASPTAAIPPSAVPAEKAVVTPVPPAAPPPVATAPKAEPKPAGVPQVIVTAAIPEESAPTSPRPGQTDERVHAFLDALRVTGIRSSGTGSRVLMNDHVYRVNDIVDRVLGLKLTEVQPESLTFTDRNGTAYVKKF